MLRLLVDAEPATADMSAYQRLLEKLSGDGAENERYFLHCLMNRGLPPPEKDHFPVIVGNGALALEVDYCVQGVNVFVDGSVHYNRWVADMDAAKRSALRDEGILFEVFRRGEEDAFFESLRNAV